MLKRLIILLLITIIVSNISAQDSFTEEHIFVDGTVVNFPSDFLIYDEGYDRIFMANEQTDIFIYMLYERTIQAQELTSYSEILEFYFNGAEHYELGAEEAITVGDREGVQYRHTVESRPDYERWIVALPVGDNGSVAVLRIQPNIDNDVEELQEADLALQIADTLQFIDFRANLRTVLGNSVPFDDVWMIEYHDTWLANSVEQTLTRDETVISVFAYSPEEVTALDLKNDPIELLYFDLFAPVDSTIEFNPENIAFVNIRGLEGIRYSLLDTVDGETIQRVYFLAPLLDESIVALEIISPIGTNILQDEEVQDIIQTIRPLDTLPPISMMALDNGYILAGVAEVRFPVYWRVREFEDGTITISTQDSSLFLLGFSPDVAIERAYPDDLAATLLNIVSPLDESVVLNPDDVMLGTLESGNPFAQISYTENDGERSYPRTVMAILLDDDAVVFAGLVPQPGIEMLSDEATAEAMAIVNTIAAQ